MGDACLFVPFFEDKTYSYSPQTCMFFCPFNSKQRKHFIQLSSFLFLFQDIFTSVSKWHSLVSNITNESKQGKSEQIRTIPTKSDQIRPNTNNSDQIRPIRPIPTDSDRIRPDPTKSDRIRQNPAVPLPSVQQKRIRQIFRVISRVAE